MAFLLNNDHHPIKPALSPTYSWSMVVIYYVIPIEIQYLFEQKLKVPRLCSYHLVIKRGWLENPYQRIQKDVYTWENHRQIVDSPASSEYWRVCVFFFRSSHWVPKFLRLLIHGSVSKPCTPGEHQNSW